MLQHISKAKCSLARSSGSLALRRSLSSTVVAAAASSSQQQQQASRADVAIVGGGVVGLALACALSRPHVLPRSARITLIDSAPLQAARDWAPTPPPQEVAPDGIAWDNRVVSLAEENRMWLQDIGAMSHLPIERLHPITGMYITDGASGSALSFDAPAQPGRLATMVELRSLQRALLRALPASVELRNARVSSIQAQDEDSWPSLELSTGERLDARLLVGADGGTSPVRTYAGIGTTAKDYRRRGLVGTLRVEGSGISGLARQRFLPTGPIAWLPLSDTTSSMVWTLPPDLCMAISDMHNDAGAQSPLPLLISCAHRLPWATLESIFSSLLSFHAQRHLAQPAAPTSVPAVAPKQDWTWLNPLLELELRAEGVPDSEAGDEVPPRVASIDERSIASFPLKMSHATSYAARSPSFVESSLTQLLSVAGLARPPANTSQQRSRVVLVGDAAHSVHPLAGQGLNLGLADARALSEALSSAAADGCDLGAPLALGAYESARWGPNEAMLRATDALHHAYAVAPPSRFPAAAPGEVDDSLHAPSSAAENLAREAFVWLRGTGMEVINELGPLKDGLTRFAGSVGPKR